MDSRAAVFSAALMSFPRSAAFDVANWIFGPDAFPPTETLSATLSLSAALPLSLSHPYAHSPRAAFCRDSTPPAPPSLFQSFGAAFHPHVCTNLHACGMIWGERICQCCFCGGCFILFFCYRLRMPLAAWWCNRSVEKDVSLWEGWGGEGFQSRCLLKIFTLCAPYVPANFTSSSANLWKKSQQRYDTGLYRKWIHNVCSTDKTWRYGLKAYLYLVIKGS